MTQHNQGSHHPKNTSNILPKLLVLGIVIALLIGSLLQRSETDAPPNVGIQPKANGGNASPDLTRIAAFQKRIAERRVDPQQKHESKKSDREMGFKSLVSAERRLMLQRITGKITVPSLVIYPGRNGYTLEEVLEMYPFLRNSDGSLNHPVTEQLQHLLAERIKSRRLLRETKDPELKKQLILSIQDKNSVDAQMSAIIRSFETRPESVVPTETLVSVSTNFASIKTAEISEFLNMLALAQTHADEGRPEENNRSLVKMSVPSRLRYTMSDQEADFLLRTPIDQLAVGVYSK